MKMNTIIHGDCLDGLKKLPSDSVDCVVTDPPYGYSFMGKDWDRAVPSVEVWQECLRVLKPGGRHVSPALGRAFAHDCPHRGRGLPRGLQPYLLDVRQRVSEGYEHWEDG
jgi:predicted methyltransferase